MFADGVAQECTESGWVGPELDPNCRRKPHICESSKLNDLGKKICTISDSKSWECALEKHRGLPPRQNLSKNTEDDLDFKNYP